MRTLVVYDSWFNNTEQIARAIGEAIGGKVHVYNVKEYPKFHSRDTDLLIVGSPTHGGLPTPAIQHFLVDIRPDKLGGTSVAAFDTRVGVQWVKLIGFAAKRIAHQLEQKGGLLVAEPQGFFVEAKQGPLRADELQRAQKWARSVAEQASLSVTA